MKKLYFLILTTVLCLCANKAWGDPTYYDVTRYYIKNAGFDIAVDLAVSNKSKKYVGSITNWSIYNNSKTNWRDETNMGNAPITSGAFSSNNKAIWEYPSPRQMLRVARPVGPLNAWPLVPTIVST